MDCVYALLKDKLSGASKLAVLGAGSVLRADDAVGMRVIDTLQMSLPKEKYPQLLLCPGETAPENFSGKICDFSPSHLVVIDAADVHKEPGSIVEIPIETVGGPTFCSHMLPLRVMLQYLAEQTGTQILLLGVQYQSLAFDGEMTEPVKVAAEVLYEAIRKWIDEFWNKV